MGSEPEQALAVVGRLGVGIGVRGRAVCGVVEPRGCGQNGSDGSRDEEEERRQLSDPSPAVGGCSNREMNFNIQVDRPITTVDTDG